MSDMREIGFLFSSQTSSSHIIRTQFINFRSRHPKFSPCLGSSYSSLLVHDSMSNPYTKRLIHSLHISSALLDFI